MACYNLIPAWRGGLLPSGKQAIIFKRPVYWPSTRSPLKLPCGQCIGCRLEKSRQWAMRCMDEASLYKRNCFLTLTYDPVCMPEDGGLESPEATGGRGAFQLFMKRLRKNYGPKGRGSKDIRFFHCGEYGETTKRPHYHACIFGFDFDDRVFYKSNSRGDRLYNSVKLDKLWPFGFAVIGDVTFDSAAYVARYVLKKITGELADEHYVDKDTGYIMPSEYVTMSRRPGLGLNWYKKFKSDMWPSDYRVVKGVKCLPPRYYFGRYELDDPLEYARIKSLRGDRAKLAEMDNSLERLAVKEEVKLAQIRNLKRSID